MSSGRGAPAQAFATASFFLLPRAPTAAGPIAASALDLGEGTSGSSGIAGTFRVPAEFADIASWRADYDLWARQQLPHILGGEVQDVLRYADEWLGRAGQFSTAALRSTEALAARLGCIYGAFDPLLPNFSPYVSEVPLLSDRRAALRLASVVESLLDTSQVIAALAQGLLAVLHVVSSVRKLMARAVPLPMPSFEAQLEELKRYAEHAKNEVRMFKLDKAALLPMLQDAVGNEVLWSPSCGAVQGKAGSPGSNLSKGALQTLAGGHTASSMRLHTSPPDYWHILNSVVAVWAHMERLALLVCPLIAGVAEGTLSLQCRVAVVVRGGDDLDAMEVTAGRCGRAAAAAGAGQCPRERFSKRLSERLRSPWGSSLWTLAGLLLALFGLSGSTAAIAIAACRRGWRSYGHSPQRETIQEDDEDAEAGVPLCTSEATRLLSEE